MGCAVVPGVAKACPQCALEFSSGEVFCPGDGARLLSLPGATASPVSGAERDPLLGQTLGGRYRILRKIGQGGMGIVYEAVHVVIEKHVALKLLREDFSHRPDVVERFRQEAKSASRIGHEHIIDISDFGVTAEGAHFFVMELLHGRDLAEELESRGPLPTRRAVAIVLQCAKALGAAHAKGIVHRDMKPENVFLVERDTAEDFVKIVDFGIAKMSDPEGANSGRRLTKTGMIFGTPEYMSPEHARGKELDHRVDLYALGIILYELLSGRVPFLGDTFMGILTQHVYEPIPPLSSVNPSCSAPARLERLIDKAVAKDPAARHQSMEELAAELAEALEGLSLTSSSAPPPGTITHVEREPAPQPGRAQPFAPVGLGHEAHRALRMRAWRWPLLASLALLVTAGALMRWHPGSAPALVEARERKDRETRTGAGERNDAGERPAPLARAAPGASAAQPAGLPEVVAPRGAVPPSEAVVRDAAALEAAVEVLTRPAGASVLVAGRTVCEPTPCRFQARRGELVKVEAAKAGFRSSTTELTPERDLQQLELVLRRREGRGVRMEGDLMLPDAFGKH